MHVPSKLLHCVLLVISITVPAALAQNNTSSARIVDKIEENQLVALKGNTPPAANIGNSLGRVSPNMPMTDLILVLKRSPEQQAAFDAFVAGQYDPTSGNYHSWLEPDEIGERFGVSPSDIASVSSWLASHGLSVDGVSRDRMTIRFSGRAAQVEAAFHTEIHNLMVRGKSQFSNLTDPQLPIALEPVIVGPKALHNFLPHPMHRLGGKVTLNEQTGRWERVPQTSPVEQRNLAVKAVPQPHLGINQGSGTSAFVIEDVTPYDFATIYNVLPLWNNSIDGTGQTIAIAGRSDVRSTDVASFRNIFGLPAGTFNTIHNGPDPGYCTGTTGLCTLTDQLENALDVEWAGGVAKGATIDLVVTQQTSTNDAVYESAHYVIANKIASILSVSYGLCELSMGTSGNASYNLLWQTAAAEGIAVFVASGDAGSATCDLGQSATVPYSAQFGLSVNGLASSPFDTAVGGTDFTWCSPTASTLCTTGYPYWASTNSASTGANVQSYIPEVPWNDTCTTPPGVAYIKSVATVTGLGNVTNAESACNFIKNNYLTIYSRYGVDLSYFVNIEGTGGGASSCTTSDGSTVASCGGGHAAPNWQTGVIGIPNDGNRELPDVSFFAGTGFWSSAYLICVADWGTCLTTTSPVNPPSGGEVGGTSVGAPAMAGVMALINQKTGSAQGNPNAQLYQLAAKQTYSNCRSQGGSVSNGCFFNDVDNGTNAMTCTAGSPNCTVSSPANTLGVLSGHGATTGFDSATGLGTMNVANVVSAWPSSAGTATATVTVTPASSSIRVDETLRVSVTVQGASGTPTGRVTLSGGSYTSSPQILSSGGVTFTIPAISFSVGTSTLTAAYSGDSIYASSSGTTIVTVAAAKLTPAVTVTPALNSIHVDDSLSVSVTVNGASSTPSGRVTLSGGSYTSSPQILSSGGTTFTIPANSFSVGTSTLSAAYSGDSIYASSSGTTIVTVTAAKLTPAVTVTPALNSIHADDSLSVSVTVQGASGTPTGSVTLSGGSYTSSPQILSSGGTTFTIPANSFSVGTPTLTAEYSGDSTYAAARGSATLAVTEPNRLTPTITVTPGSNSIARNQSLSVAVAATGISGVPTGTVTLTGGGYTSSPTTLVGGQAALTIPANTFLPGMIGLTISYGGNATYNSATGMATITVSKVTPTIVVSPDRKDIYIGQALDVGVSVSGSSDTPTGTVTLSGGGYSSAARILSLGQYVFTIPAGALAVGSDTLTTLYSGDGVYLSGSASADITVSPGTYGLASLTPPAVSRGGSASSTITVRSDNGYSGTVTLTCALVASPAGALRLPRCEAPSGASTITLSPTSTSGTGRVVVSTTAATIAQVRRNMRTWAGSATALALMALCMVPKRNRRSRRVLGVCVLAVLFAGAAACGGGGGNGGGGGGGGGDSGTTPGSYTFLVTGSGNPTISPAPTTSFSLTVN